MTQLAGQTWICNLFNICLFPEKLIWLNFGFANSCSAGIQSKYMNNTEMFPVSIVSCLNTKVHLSVIS